MNELGDVDNRLLRLLEKAIPQQEGPSSYLEATALTADDIWRAVERIRDEMPVIAVHPDMARLFEFSVPVRVVPNSIIEPETFYLMPSDAEMRRRLEQLTQEGLELD